MRRFAFILTVLFVLLAGAAAAGQQPDALDSPIRYAINTRVNRVFTVGGLPGSDNTLYYSDQLVTILKANSMIPGGSLLLHQYNLSTGSHLSKKISNLYSNISFGTLWLGGQ